LTKLKPNQREHYVDNKKFYSEMIKFKSSCEEATNNNEPKPRVPPYIGECIMKIAYKLSNKHNFINYPFKEEMIGDGIENCILYIRNFNPEKSNNPFAYFTQIIYYAFLRRIEKEKKGLYTKFKATELFNLHNSLSPEDTEYIKSSSMAAENASIFIRDFEEKRFNK
tara:strand:- start:495 stop:995 length:501 start_codon:yes stop_codon:yes gene_type:complete